MFFARKAKTFHFFQKDEYLILIRRNLSLGFLKITHYICVKQWHEYILIQMRVAIN